MIPIEITGAGLVLLQGNGLHGRHLFLLFLMTKLSRYAKGGEAAQSSLKPFRLRSMFSRYV
ncbi:hypothetical protein D9M68_577090 [compost metagenome]